METCTSAYYTPHDRSRDCQVYLERCNSAWGWPRYSWGTPPTTYRFTGQRVESAAGLSDDQTRFYAPALGLFVSPDTIVPEPASRQH